jgi:predicted permease
MNLLDSFHFRIATFFERSQMNAEMEEELRSHVQHRADDLEASGLPRAEAERRARVEFGGQEKYKAECHEALGPDLLRTSLQDARYSLRMLCKSPGFTIAAVLTLALAIGANAVVFGIMDGLVLRPLNVPQAESLLATESADDPVWQSYPNYLDLRDRNRSFQDLAAFSMIFAGLDTGRNPVAATGYAATGNYFDVLKIQPYLGNFFHRSDEHGPNSAPYIVFTYGYWHSHFHDDRGVVGRVVQLDKHPFTVIGVAPPGFQGTLLFGSPDFFVPIVNQDQLGGGNTLNERGSRDAVFEVFGHLKPGVTPAQAAADVNDVGANLARTYPNEVSHTSSSLSRPGLTSFGGPVREFVAALMLLAGLILLAACANLGSLFAAHAADRSREVALRLALGSSRRRILRQLMTEAMLISLAGGALGLVCSVVLLSRLSTWQPFGAPLRLPVNPDAKLYIVALVLALVSALLFGIVPVRQVLRANPYEIVKAGSAARLGRRIAVRDVLLVLQIALCAVLVTSSMVAVRGLARSLHADLGFEPRNTMLLSANLAMGGYSGDRVLPMQKRLIEAMQTIPGVEQVGLVNNYPPLVYAAAIRGNVFNEKTRDLRPSNVAARPYRYDVSPGYFQAASTRLLAGRDFLWHDDNNSPPVAIANREFAREMFGSVAKAVGGFCRMQDGTRVQIVGVVEDGKYFSLNEDSQPALFRSSLQIPSSAAYLVLRSHRDPQELAVIVRSKLREVDSGLPGEIQTWNSMLAVALFPARMATASLGVMGLMGAMLSITGIFGMAAYSVSKRIRELGIRIALGAQRSEVLQAALGLPLKLLAIGSAAGLLLGILATRVLAFIVYQATPRDPLVLAGVVLAMLLVGLLATWIPAQRALSIDPLVLLRSE